jgi:pyridoxamine 5'-phosphate oxidase
MAGDPLQLFEAWRAEAAPHEPDPFTAMTLATADADGRPSARTVLLKGVDGRGFTFFTNRQSRKGIELAANPRAALVFRFRQPHRQVVVLGDVEPVGEDESDDYWATRPRGSQLGAWASDQSQVIAGREVLEARVAALAQRWPEGTAIPRPPHWGGFRVLPETVEFWQDRPDRLHDRWRYCRQPGGRWAVDRLAP